jgi:hypothetical protein
MSEFLVPAGSIVIMVVLFGKIYMPKFLIAKLGSFSK